jgi:hypothetical protein
MIERPGSGTNPQKKPEIVFFDVARQMQFK